MTRGLSAQLFSFQESQLGGDLLEALRIPRNAFLWQIDVFLLQILAWFPNQYISDSDISMLDSRTGVVMSLGVALSRSLI